MEKKELIADIEKKILLILKECEAKNMKVTHIKFERDSLNNLMQVEILRKQEQSKEAKEQIKRIEIKKKEDEMAFSIAQNEVKRQAAVQEEVINGLID